MQWIVLDDDSVLEAYLATEQVTAIRQSHQRSGQPDPFYEIRDTVCARVRTSIGRLGKKISATAGAIPPSAKDYAIILILDRMSLRIPTLRLTQAQIEAAKEARLAIERLGDPMVAVEAPEDPVDPDVLLQGGVSTVRAYAQHTTPAKLSGLI